MRVSHRVDLAVRVLVDLARSEAPRTCRQLALRARVPSSSLATLLADLHRAGLVAARRGRWGGYVLGRDAELMTVAEVLVALDDIDVPFVSTSPLAALWDRLHRETLLAADRTTVAQLASACDQGGQAAGEASQGADPPD